MDIIEQVAVPGPVEALAEWLSVLERSLNQESIGVLLSNLSDMYTVASGKSGLSSGDDEDVLHRCFLSLRATLALTPLGAVGGFPARFWSSKMGGLVFACFDKVHGSGLLSQSQVARELTIPTTRLGALQREHRIDYLVDPRAAHPARNRRRMTWRMIEDYRKREAGVGKSE